MAARKRAVIPSPAKGPDVDMAQAEGLTEEQLSEDLGHDCVEYSKVSEVAGWIKASNES